MKNNKYMGYLLIAPAYSLFLVFFVLPLLYSFGLTFFEWNGFTPDKNFVGLANYVEMFGSKEFYNALKNTAFYTCITTIISTTLAVLISVVIQKGIKGYSFIKSAYFFPHIVSMVAVGVVWSWIFLPGKGGLLNSMIGIFGIEPQSWLADPKLAMASLIIIGVWKSVGYNILITIGGLIAIPQSVYEASSIDGANRWQTFWKITLPLLKPTLFFVIVSATTASLFQVFDIINVTTQGGPVGSTDMLVSHLYKAGFGEYRLGYASAVAFVLFVIAVSITVIQKKVLEKE